MNPDALILFGQGVGCYRSRGDASHWKWDKKNSTLQCTNGSCKGRYLALKPSSGGSTPLAQERDRSKKHNYFYCEHRGSKKYGIALVRKQLIRPSSSNSHPHNDSRTSPRDQLLDNDEQNEAPSSLDKLTALAESKSATIESRTQLALENPDAVGTPVAPQSSENSTPDVAAHERSSSVSLRHSAVPTLRRALSLPLETLQGSPKHLPAQEFDTVEPDHESSRSFGSGKKRALSRSLRVPGQRRTNGPAARSPLARRRSLSGLPGRVSSLSAEVGLLQTLSSLLSLPVFLCVV